MTGTFGVLSRITRGLTKTRTGLSNALRGILGQTSRLDEEALARIEEVLIQADVGATTTAKLVDLLSSKMTGAHSKTSANDLYSRIVSVLSEEITRILGENPGLLLTSGVNVILMVGVNGSGKTTTAAKLAYLLKNENRRVILAAADTFRAAAIEQLEAWGKKVGVPVIKHKEGSDPAAVIYDAVMAAKSRSVDVVVADTAGRLHTKSNLMEELKKCRRVANREVKEAPQEVLLVLDATTGQNALQQARVFKDAVGVTGVILTKLDGTAKGGVVVSVREETGLPIKFVGTGEGIEDLSPFDASAFARSLFDGV
ncbi:MAG TPA: signal recognition particle-docking protein FtsY [Clostridia bacterium]|nr:signal recognition particle-docking protein FtsY [Clostridia bacterium]